MTNPATLLAPKSTALQRAIAQACAPLGDIPVPIRTLLNPDACPVSFLPHLAWAFSVDRWDDAWPEETKRAAIKSAYFIHRYKGTVAAVRRVVETLGYLVKIDEWWQTEPKGPRGTFALEVGVSDSGITDELRAELERLIEDAKPKSRHLTGLAISMKVGVTEHIAVGAYHGEELTVYPYLHGVIATTMRQGFAAIAHIVDTMTVYP
jgi:phage tail P2-like protein